MNLSFSIRRIGTTKFCWLVISALSLVPSTTWILYSQKLLNLKGRADAKEAGSIEKKLGLHSRAVLAFPTAWEITDHCREWTSGQGKLSSKTPVTEQDILNTGHSSTEDSSVKKNSLYQIPDSEKQTQRKWKNRTRHTDTTVMFPPQPTHKHGYTQ